MSHFTKMEKAKSNTTRSKLETLDEVLEYPITGLQGQYSKQAAEFFGIRTAYSEEDGKTPIASYFPYYSQSNKLVGFKKRDWTIEKEADYHFTTVGKVSADCKMFGQHKFGDGAKKIVCVEGETDVAATWHVLNKVIEDRGIKQSFAVVGLPCGAVQSKISASANEKFLLNCQELILGFDNDQRELHEKKSVMRGKEALETFFSVLLSDKIRSLTWPEGNKDAKDYASLCLKENKVDEFYNFTLYGGKKYLGSKIIKPSSISFDDMIAIKEKGFMVKALPKLMKQTRGIRKNEFTIVFGPSGSGKSSIVSEIMYSLAEQGQKIGIIYLEEEAKESIQRMMARQLEVNYNNFKFDPKSCASIEDLQAAYDWVTDEDEDKFTLVDHFGSLLTNELMDKIRQMVFIDGVDFIVLDHLSIVISGNDTKDERKDLDVLATQLASFVVPNDVGIIAVSHINREGSKESKPPRGKEDQPFWVRCRKEDLRGSSSLEGLSFNIWAVEPEILPDRSRGRIRLVNLKNRPCGVMGIADILKMEETSGLLVDADDHDDEPL